MTPIVTKVVFDTNILVSGHFWKGPPYRCLLAANAGLVLLVLKHLLTLGSVDGIEIVTAREFLDRLPLLTDDSDPSTAR